MGSLLTVSFCDATLGLIQFIDASLGLIPFCLLRELCFLVVDEIDLESVDSNQLRRFVFAH